MSDAPERIWTCDHLGEYGSYFPEAVEAEGEFGGQAVEYTRSDLVGQLIAEAVEAERKRCAKLCEEWFGTPDADDIARILHARISIAEGE